MLSNFPNWGSGVTFPVVPISCFNGEYYCCSEHLLNARFLAKNWDPGESILLRLRGGVLQVALKMPLKLGNHFFNWPFQAWMMCTLILVFGVIVAGAQLWVSAIWPQSSSSPTTRKSLSFHWQQSWLEDILFMVFLYSFSQKPISWVFWRPFWWTTGLNSLPRMV